MKKLFLSMLLCMMTLGAAAQSTLKGDVDGDGRVTIGDVTALVDYLLSHDDSTIDLAKADLDENGFIGIADVTALIDMILEADGHEYVDLGLPSGTLWATCNVGASAPEEYGDYFAWGETETKDNYTWNYYKWCDSNTITLTKYCNDSDYGYNGFVDDKTELDPEDDAAYVNWGSSWRMPTYDQLQELIDNCTWTWTTLNGVDGYLVTGSNENNMFLPTSGYRYDSSLNFAGSVGDYWSRTLETECPDRALYLIFGESQMYMTLSMRLNGLTVRAIRVP